jgi:Domain of unknown function (DUF4160)
MPTIARFYGITVRMWHDDHPPPHIHVSYQEFEAEVSIMNGKIRHGRLPARIAALVNEWCLQHKLALLQNWQRAVSFQPLVNIRSDTDD